MKKPERRRRPKGIRLVRIACIMIEKELHEKDLRANKKRRFYCYDPAVIAASKSFCVITDSCKNSFLRSSPVIRSFGRNLFAERDRQNSFLVFVHLFATALTKSLFLSSNLPPPITVETIFHPIKQ